MNNRVIYIWLLFFLFLTANTLVSEEILLEVEEIPGLTQWYQGMGPKVSRLMDESTENQVSMGFTLLFDTADEYILLDSRYPEPEDRIARKMHFYDFQWWGSFPFSDVVLDLGFLSTGIEWKKPESGDENASEISTSPETYSLREDFVYGGFSYPGYASPVLKAGFGMYLPPALEERAFTDDFFIPRWEERSKQTRQLIRLDIAGVDLRVMFNEEQEVDTWELYLHLQPLDRMKITPELFQPLQEGGFHWGFHRLEYRLSDLGFGMESLTVSCPLFWDDQSWLPYRAYPGVTIFGWDQHEIFAHLLLQYRQKHPMGFTLGWTGILPPGYFSVYLAANDTWKAPVFTTRANPLILGVEFYGKVPYPDS